MSLSEEIRAVGELYEDSNIDYERIELMEKIGASPIEVLMLLVNALEPWRAERPDEYEAMKPNLRRLSSHLEGKQRFIWERVFTCRNCSA